MATIKEIEEPYLDVQGVCKHLGIPQVTVYRLLKKNGIPAHRIGGKWRFTREEVDEWVKMRMLLTTITEAAVFFTYGRESSGKEE
jgi:excisionase family DNA binding protein